MIKGNTDWEDVLLNLAGAAAPVVAFVPTAETGECRSVPPGAGVVAADVANNVFALLVVGLLALVVALVLALRSRPPGRAIPTAEAVGLGAAGLLFVAVVVPFGWARSAFLAHAHYAAAGVLFCCMVAVVTINAWSVARQRVAGGAARAKGYANAYTAIAVVMVGSVICLLGWRAIFGWHHAILAIEVVLVVSFAAFWAVQTRELWHAGRRVIGATRSAGGR